jgi:hypothetical protein
MPANAAPGERQNLRDQNQHGRRDHAPMQYRYTTNPSPVSTGRLVTVYVDRDFSEFERERITSSIRQWNTALNGFIQIRVGLLPSNVSAEAVNQYRRGGAWIIAKVDSGHPSARNGQALQAMAMTVGGKATMSGANGGGFVYVIHDRFHVSDLEGVMLHEFGHVLGAGHDPRGQLMGPVYNRGNQCIDRGAIAMVAEAQRLPLNHMNFCVGANQDSYPNRQRDMRGRQTDRRG